MKNSEGVVVQGSICWAWVDYLRFALAKNWGQAEKSVAAWLMAAKIDKSELTATR